jgi:hypothetical protein
VCRKNPPIEQALGVASKKSRAEQTQGVAEKKRERADSEAEEHVTGTLYMLNMIPLYVKCTTAPVT